MSSLRSCLVVMNLAFLRFRLPLLSSPTVRPGANFCEWNRAPSRATVLSSAPHFLVRASLSMRKTNLLSCLNYTEPILLTRLLCLDKTASSNPPSTSDKLSFSNTTTVKLLVPHLFALIVQALCKSSILLCTKGK